MQNSEDHDAPGSAHHHPDWPSAMAAWREALGNAQVDDAVTAQLRYGADTTASPKRLAAAVRACSQKEVQAVLSTARQFRTPMHPISTGRNWGYGTSLPASDGVALLDLGGMNRILHFDRDFGVVTLEPGVTQGQLMDYLDQHGLDYLVPVTGAGPQCSLLANALERGYGVTPHVDHFAAVNDLEAVLPDGSIYRGMLNEAAGEELARLFRWGLGPYTHGLFTQSGMGVVTRMSIALAPRPECTMACLFAVTDDRQLEAVAAAIRTAIQRLSPTLGAINLMNRHRVLAMSAPYPPADQLDEAGRIPAELLEAMGRRYQVSPWTGFATLYGSRTMVQAARTELKRILSPCASRILFFTPDRAQQLARLTARLPGRWASGIRSLTRTLAQSLQLVAGRPNETALPLAYWRHPSYQAEAGKARDPGKDGCGLIWYPPLVPMKPELVRRYTRFVEEVTARFGLEPLITFTTVNDKVFDSTVPLVFDKARPEAAQAARACYEAMVRQGRELGFFPYRFSIDGMRLVTEMAPESTDFAKQLKSLRDVQGLLAPGRYA